MINYFTFLSWIDALPGSWDEWRIDFYALPIKYQNTFWRAVEESGISNFEQFLAYMENY